MHYRQDQRTTKGILGQFIIKDTLVYLDRTKKDLSYLKQNATISFKKAVKLLDELMEHSTKRRKRGHFERWRNKDSSCQRCSTRKVRFVNGCVVD